MNTFFFYPCEVYFNVASVILCFVLDLSLTLPSFFPAAADPRHWSRDDVTAFLRWFEREFELPAIDHSKFSLNGESPTLIQSCCQELLDIVIVIALPMICPAVQEAWDVATLSTY